MLEQDQLLLLPEDEASRRAIVAATTRAPVGLARWQPGPPRGWRRWLRPVLEVREHEDEPLVFTLRRCWHLLPWYEVRDAEEYTVGYLLGPLIQDRYQQRLALRQREGQSEVCHYLSSQQHSLARLIPGPEGLQIQFAPWELTDPFVRMLLLASALL
jgi:hypothetical protein